MRIERYVIIMHHLMVIPRWIKNKWEDFSPIFRTALFVIGVLFFIVYLMYGASYV